MVGAKEVATLTDACNLTWQAYRALLITQLIHTHTKRKHLAGVVVIVKVVRDSLESDSLESGGERTTGRVRKTVKHAVRPKQRFLFFSRCFRAVEQRRQELCALPCAVPG